MKNQIQFFMAKALFLSFLFTGTLALTACSPSLSSDGFWKGEKAENKWVKEHFLSPKGSEKEQAGKNSAYEDPAQPDIKDGKKYKIGVVISGNYWEFFDNLKGLVEGFAHIGWANPVVLPSSVQNCRQLISWLKLQDYSGYIEFSEDAFVNLAWGENKKELNKGYFQSKPDVDIILAYGGMAAKAFYKEETYPIPVLSDAITDSFSAGITQSLEDSGKDFYSNKIDPEIFKQQIRLFHDAVGFKSLGIVYGDDEYGKIYGAVRDVEEVARKEGFSIIRNTNVKESMEDDTVELYLKALEDVASRSDAVYVGASTAVTEYNIIPRIVEILDKYKKPSFALEGSIRVKEGILYSLSASGMTRSGIYMATKISHILNGISPRKLNQHFENSPSIAINLETARIIGYKPPIDLLISSDEVYKDRTGASSSLFSASGSYKTSGDFANYASPSGTSAFQYAPHKKKDGSPWQIGLIQSGSYWEFFEHFKGIIMGLQACGWIDSGVTIPRHVQSIPELLDALGENYSEFIRFDRQYCVNLNWGESLNKAASFLQKEKPPLDLIIALGGVAGKLFVPYKTYPIPVVLEAVTDPVGSGIIYSPSDSGKDFLTCRVDRSQYQRQIRLFHDITGFKRLGIIYGDDEYGRLYGAVNDVELMAQKLGFTLIRNTAVRETMAPDTPELYLEALRELCPQVDAVYIGASTAITEYGITREAAEILIEAQKPSFALEGEVRVKDGILMGVSSLGIEKTGLYNAGKIGAILSGKAPRLLNQVFTGIPSITLNVDTAEKIGMDVPLSVLSTIDKLYRKE